MALTAQQARAIFTTAYLKALKEDVKSPSFLMSFFNQVTFATKTIGIEVQRGTERIAVDVLRGVDGKHNTFSRSTEKQFVPPFYNESFSDSSLDRYNLVFGQNSNFVPKNIGYLAKDVKEKYSVLVAKIERAKEKQCGQVFDTGVVTLINGDNIDFKRKSTSMVDPGVGHYWSTATTDVETQLISGAEFVRNEGKNGATKFNLIISSQAWINLKKTDFFKNNANYNQVKLIDITMPQKDSFGAGYHGQISAGAYIFNVWTYDETYENEDGTRERYIDENNAIILPVDGTRFEIAHAGIPAIIRDKSKAEFSSYIVQKAAKYWFNNWIDEKAKAHIFEVFSAPLSIPVTVDMIFTLKVLA